MNKKDLIFVILIVFAFLLGLNFNDRYAIINTESGAVLLDKKDGFSWLQVLRGEEVKITWREINSYDNLENNIIKGKEKEHKKLQKKLLTNK